jgi:hypothetical protein
MSITTEQVAPQQLDSDVTSRTVRLRVPLVTVPNADPDFTRCESSRPDPESAPQPIARFQLGRRTGTKPSDTTRPKVAADRRKMKWRSRMWAVALALTCLSASALVFDVLIGRDSDPLDADVVEFEDARAGGTDEPVAAATSPVVAAELRTGAAAATKSAIRPTQFEFRSNPSGNGPQGALLDGTIQFDE